MIRETIDAVMRESLLAISSPRFFETERGFQGELLVQLAKRMHLPDQAIIEQEYQKRAINHGLNCRPDIIIHEPYNPKHHEGRHSGNYAVVELKLKGSLNEAMHDFASIGDMIRVLSYPLGFFINIGSENSYASSVPADIRASVIALAIFQRAGKTYIAE